jgi:hypothetical protein
MKKKCRDNYAIPGLDWLWYLDGHDKLSHFDIETYRIGSGTPLQRPHRHTTPVMNAKPAKTLPMD